jgi:DNA polymerase-4
MALRAIFIDFNSFFASVEQQDQPELRGKPVAVSPVDTDSTCAIAASYEAKKFGIKTGTNIGEARKMCPGLNVIPARPATYIDYHRKLIKVVEKCVHVEEVASIDEMWGELTGKWREREHATALARQIKAAIAAQVGKYLTCSIGIAPNPFLAKTASDMQKPDGLVLLDHADLPHALHRLELRDLCGIGRNMEQRFLAHGISTVAQLCAASKEDLRAVWKGIEGDRFWSKLRGDWILAQKTKHSTLGHSHVLGPELRTWEGAYAVLHRLTQKAAMRLRQMGFTAARLSIFVKRVGGGGWGDYTQFLETQDTLEFLNAMTALWERRPEMDGQPLAVGVTLFELAELSNTPRLLPGFRPDRTKLDHTLDLLNEKFGKNTVYFGGAHNGRHAANLRIAFHHVPDPELLGERPTGMKKKLEARS